MSSLSNILTCNYCVEGLLNHTSHRRKQGLTRKNSFEERRVKQIKDSDEDTSADFKKAYIKPAVKSSYGINIPTICF